MNGGTHHVLLQVGLAGEAQTTGRTVEISLALVVHRSPVVLQRALVAEGRGADVTVEDVAGMGGQNMPGQAGLAGEGGVARVALVGLVSRVGFHMTRQSLFVLELDTTLWARVGLGVVTVVELFVNRQMVFSREGLGTVCAGKLEILLVSPLVPPETVAPLESLSTLSAHVLAVVGVTVHVTRQVLLHSGTVLTQRTGQLGGSSLALPAPLLQRSSLLCGCSPLVCGRHGRVVG